MNNRIPPPVYVLLAVIVMVLLKRGGLEIPLHLPHAGRIAAVIAALAAVILVAAIVSFHRAKTTVDPLHPDKASALVQSGLFRWSRNPMYVGLTMVLVAAAVYLQTGAGLVLAAIYVVLITAWQIKPEERALQQLFGTDYDDYCRRVRRWL